MRTIKICYECYIDNEILLEIGDTIIITDVEECEFSNKEKVEK